MRQALKKILPESVVESIRDLRQRVFDVYASKSYSQEGEDRILSNLLGNKVMQGGFYVDVGAHHPYRYSNTYLFYRAGWRGLNVDASAKSIELFRRYRPRDTSVQAAISRERGEMTFYEYNEPAVNRLSITEPSSPGADCHIVRTSKVITQPLGEILSNHLPVGQTIDFMSVDIEGFDLQALQSNDWQRYRPIYIVVEAIATKVRDVLRTPITIYLADLGYELIAKTGNNVFFALNESGSGADHG